MHTSQIVAAVLAVLIAIGKAISYNYDTIKKLLHNRIFCWSAGVLIALLIVALIAVAISLIVRRRRARLVVAATDDGQYSLNADDAARAAEPEVRKGSWAANGEPRNTVFE